MSSVNYVLKQIPFVINILIYFIFKNNSIHFCMNRPIAIVIKFTQATDRLQHIDKLFTHFGMITF